MDSDQGKIFIGGISWETSEEILRDYFSNYGDVMQTIVMREKLSGKPRGFGFVVFADPSILDRVLQDKHTIDGRTVDVKLAMSREEQQTFTRVGNGRSVGAGGNMRTKKIFVGGLPPILTEEAFKEYFETYGHVTDVVVMYDQNTGRPRGFGFISFDSEEAVDRVLHKTFHDLNGKQVEVKRALPKDANPGGGSRTSGDNISLGGGYQSYGASNGNANSYDGRLDSNRYMQPQGTGGGFPPYSSGYGYNPSNNGVGYGSYGNYGGANTGYGGPASTAYGNPNVPNTGYGNAPQGGPRNSWSGQAPSGYGAMGYGNPAPWGTPGGNVGVGSGVPSAGMVGQSPSAGGFGNQNYGYGGWYGNQGYGYGGNDGTYGNPSGYGAVGGRSSTTPNSNGGGPSGGEYQGNGGNYGDTNGNPGYGNAMWRSDSSQASGTYGSQASGPYGGQLSSGYGSSAHARQVQQQ